MRTLDEAAVSLQPLQATIHVTVTPTVCSFTQSIRPTGRWTTVAASTATALGPDRLTSNVNAALSNAGYSPLRVEFADVHALFGAPDMLTLTLTVNGDRAAWTVTSAHGERTRCVVAATVAEAAAVITGTTR